ncbi:MAG: hypothetical protein K0S14_240 [Thermomicrobiales bacterium]|jgi:hypothetical protein|nr:hypothetical protein [Thermomicrobiales bacterium]
MRSLFILAFLLGLLAGPLVAQDQKFHVAVDTAGVSPVGDNIYTTWVYALATPTSFPSSGILVAFDCANRKVKRLAHVVYQWNADSSGVEGPIVEDNGAWMDVSIPALYDLVCRVGPTHGPSVVESRKPTGDPRVRIS